MAENEYLDSTKARRWQSVAQAIGDGGSVEDVADRIEDCLHKTLRRIRKDVPLGEIISAFDDPVRLNEVFDQINGAHDVKDFLNEAASMDAVNRMQRLEAFLDKSLNNCLYDIPWLVSDGMGNVSITEARNVLGTARLKVQPEIRRIAKKLAENPNWNFRRSSHRPVSSTSVDKTKSMLSESLLAGFSK